LGAFPRRSGKQKGKKTSEIGREGGEPKPRKALGEFAFRERKNGIPKAEKEIVPSSKKRCLIQEEKERELACQKNNDLRPTVGGYFHFGEGRGEDAMAGGGAPSLPKSKFHLEERGELGEKKKKVTKSPVRGGKRPSGKRVGSKKVRIRIRKQRNVAFVGEGNEREGGIGEARRASPTGFFGEGEKKRGLVTRSFG